MILLAQWYTPESSVRRSELQQVRERNERSGLFSQCIYVDGDSRRWSYGDFLSLAVEEYPGEVIVLANTDIEFNETLRTVPSNCRPDRVFALTRWESLSSPRMIGHFADDRFFSGSQDTWIFIAGEVPVPDELQNIPLGVVGCENAFLGAMIRAGCEVFDPALEVVTLHHHSEGPPSDRPGVVNCFYAYPELTSWHGEGRAILHKWPLDGESATIVETVTRNNFPTAASAAGVVVAESESPPKEQAWHQ